jgi:predicted nucleic acid-binding Zn ribbon protein
LNDKRRKPVPIAEALTGFLNHRGLSARVEQAEAVVDWPAAVGAQIAAVTTPISITPDGTLFVAVTTNSWMNELSLMEPELLKALNAAEGPARVRIIRFQLRR